MQWTSAPNIAGAPLPQRARSYWKARAGAIRDTLEGFLERERGQLPSWLVVGFGTGIALWLALASPRQWAALLCAAGGLAILGFCARGGRAERALGWFSLAVALGCSLIWIRSEAVAAPRLDRPRITTFEARVERVEPIAAKGDLRLTLAPVDKRLPPRVRVSMPREGSPDGLAVDSKVELKARLVPPPPMALPGSYDFARDAWFRRIGGVGRALGPVTVLDPRPATGIDAFRDRLGRHIREQLPGSAGTIATALATGDKKAVSEEDARAMRRSGLAHLLAVSGLHIGAVVGAAMLLTLKLLAVSQRAALRFNLILVAAGVGALAGIGYTLLTGMQVPTVRSCIAALLVLGGLAIGREAISLRTLSVGALIILALRPELIASASFQFSFAAVASIIALHSSQWGRRTFQRRDERIAARFCRFVFALFMTGLAVEIALTPFALYHFHKAGLYGVAANLIAIPLTTFVIMPFEALALFLDLVGAGAPAWFVAGSALDLLLALAHTVADAPGAVATLPSMPVWAFGLLTAGGLWLCLWTSRARWLGLVPAMVGAVGAAAAPAPDLLVTGDGRHLAVVGEDGTPLLLRSRSGDFIRELMAEAAGVDQDPEALAERPGTSCSRDSCVTRIERAGRSWQLLATRSSTPIAWADLVAACSEADIVVSDRWLPKACEPRWLKLDRKALERTGGVAIRLATEPRVTTVAESIGRHPWAADLPLERR
ncbi:MAG TPA: ComEC/Rec2 family competence protein [Sphingomicrobium sp.]|nr:ComEC/Rec2 family competence protein [Sphingomicrobium sp.]